ncbi:hypothetical protein EVAR_95276_1 [Eumeta japonica]|uniref:Uncharacterized protein n=1 Tax=Eumeta variegata TaxID=151549 RepID=A0A4C1ULM4_EUMVA|nr:hypothetical protein EVAR_95276_1 [Eumeta japonica]
MAHDGRGGCTHVALWPSRLRRRGRLGRSDGTMTSSFLMMLEYRPDGRWPGGPPSTARSSDRDDKSPQLSS